jgi:YidC/Oxa1 family membrane protein insertase
MLYNIIIFPILQIIKISYTLFFKIFENPAISVLGVSFAVTLLCLPLYIVAENWQRIERDTAKKLKPKIDKIKAVFRGDEQYMILSVLYRQNHYHPVFALRSSLGLLIQIPFFIAAYTYLNDLNALEGVSFLFIKNLKAPDAILSLVGFKINILPIAMTLINCAAGFIYTKGFSFREKAQIYGMAAVFLILLYNSPSGLVLYWTMNNIFSLIKNIFYKFKSPSKVLYIISFIFAFLAILFFLFFHDSSIKRRAFFIILSLFVMAVPLFVKFVNYSLNVFFQPLLKNPKQRKVLFLLSCAELFLLTGIVIPSTVISSSPQEFSFIDNYQSPLMFIYFASLQALGLFVIWPFFIYYLFNKKIQALITLLFFIIVPAALINTFFFSGSYGLISTTFQFETPGVLNAARPSILLNIIITVIVVIFGFLLCKFTKPNITSAFSAILIITLLFFATRNIATIQRDYVQFADILKNNNESPHKISPVFSLSKDKQNVVVFMIDGAINGFFEPIFSEYPPLKNQFEGFTLFPNTLAFASHTLPAIPPVWGGYEYTPLEMNKKSNISLVQKHNEALFVLPFLFSQSGYTITVTDPSWSNYSLIPDITIYDGLENINAKNLIGKYSNLWYTKNDYAQGMSQSSQIIENILWFSFLKISPLIFRGELYDDGRYWSAETYISSAVFVNNYSVLDFLPELTSYDSEKPSVILMTNETTHDSIYLQYPDYSPKEEVTDIGTGIFSKEKKYHSNNAFYRKFGIWLDELKKNNVYDNTRIIIVSDHGAGLDARLPGTPISIPGENREKYNPLLLFKDFYQRGEPKIDMAFMTNADIPSLAVKNIIDGPENPFTGKPLNDNPKQDGVFITTNHLPMAHNHNKNTFNINKNQWIFVHDNIFDGDNWLLKEPE